MNEQLFAAKQEQFSIEVVAALRRAGRMARDEAILAGMDIVVVREGRIVQSGADELSRTKRDSCTTGHNKLGEGNKQRTQMVVGFKAAIQWLIEDEEHSLPKQRNKGLDMMNPDHLRETTIDVTA